MGQGVGKGGNIRAKGAGTVDEAELLENFICKCIICNSVPKLVYLSNPTVDDVVSALTQTLTTLSQTHRRPPLASIFLLNNISHLRLHLLANPSSSIDELLSKPTRELLNSSFRSAKADYFASNYTPLLNTLSEEKEASGLSVVGVGPSTRSLLKDKWSKYWEVLDEIVERHRFAKVLADDEEARALLADEAVKFVVPTLERFMSKNRDKDFSKSEYSFQKSLFVL